MQDFEVDYAVDLGEDAETFFLRRKELWQPGKIAFISAGMPTHCRDCKAVFHTLTIPIGVKRIGDVPLPKYRYIRIFCPQLHQIFEWIE